MIAVTPHRTPGSSARSKVRVDPRPLVECFATARRDNMWLIRLAAALLAVQVGGCGGVRRQGAGPDRTAPEIKARDAAAAARLGGARVAPVFLHGKGKGFDGSPSLSYPVYLRESEALPVIIDELGRYGVDLSEREVAVDKVTFSWRKYLCVQKKDGTEDWDIIPDAENSTTLAMDVADRKRRIAVEFIGWDDYMKMGGVDVGRMETFDERTGKRWGGGWTVWEYDFPDAARYVREQIERQGRKPWYYGLFYDPVIIPRTKEAWDSIMEPMFMGTNEEPGESDRRSEALREAIEKARSAARKQAHELLRAQVRDFAEWLKHEGAI
jgi:hypothetical protein